MNTNDKETLRRTQQPILDQLQIAGADTRRPGAIRCPFHEDTHPSSRVYCDDKGVYRFHCFTCNINMDVYDVQAKLSNRSPGDVLKELKKDSPPPAKYSALPPLKSENPNEPRVFAKISDIEALFVGMQAKYVYDDENGAPLLFVYRIVDLATGKKTFQQASPVERGFVRAAPPKPWPIYRRSSIKDFDAVVVVEGEKCADTLEAIGIPATTSPCGAGNADNADWSPLAGKTVYLWPDNDPVDKDGNRKGVAHMRRVATLLEELNPPPNLFWVDCDAFGLPPKGDVVDFLELHGGPTPESRQTSICAILETSDPIGPAAEMRQQIDSIISGQMAVVDFPWRILSSITTAMYPGTITLLCGDPGSTKSFWILEALLHWHSNGIRCCVFEMEEDRNYHLLRALAQIEYNSDLTNLKWIAEHSEETIAAFQRHQSFLNSFGRCISDAPDKTLKLDDVLAWINRRAIQGNRIIVVDPITACPTKEAWSEDSDFLLKAKKIARQYGVSLLFVTHPKKGSKVSGMHDLSGGAAYQRFAQTILWIRSFHDSKKVTVENFNGVRDVQINRSIQIPKCRNSYGAGMEIGFHFNGGSFRSNEEGVVRPENGSRSPMLKQQSRNGQPKTNPTGDDF